MIASKKPKLHKTGKKYRELEDWQDNIKLELARRKLIHFVEYTFPQYITGEVHRLIADHLDKVVEGKIKRLIICQPPQTGKSELCSVRLSAYWLGRNPDLPVIISSYGAQLARKMSMRARDVVLSDEYKKIFPHINMRKDSKSKSEWGLVGYKGEVIAAGAGGSITGMGAGLGVIDDPFKGWQEARSELIRERVWDWYRSVLRTRIWDGGAIVIPMTRWHNDDLIGRITSQDNESWTVLRIPALCETNEERKINEDYLGFGPGVDLLGREPGESIHEERFSRLTLEATQFDVGSMVWAGLYQQVPRVSDGNRIKASMINIASEIPAIKNKVRYWDLASTQDGGCRTAGIEMGIDKDENYYVLDVTAGQWGGEERNKQISLRDSLSKCSNYIEQEPGSSGKDAIEALKKELRHMMIYEDRPTGSKEIRFEPVITKMEQGKFFIAAGSWNKLYIEELLDWPFGKFKDQCDATSGAFKFVYRGKAEYLPISQDESSNKNQAQNGYATSFKSRWQG